MIAGTPDRADAEPLGGNRIELTVAVPRDQHLGAVFLLVLDERRHEMLTVPEREDQRLVRQHAFVDVRRLVGKPRRQPDEAQIFGREHPERALNPAAAQHIAKKFLQRDGFVSWPGSSRRCRWTTK